MWGVFYFFTWPFFLMYYMLKFMFEIIKLIVIVIIEIIFIFKRIIKNNLNKSYNYTRNESKINKTQKISWREEEFENEANLWGLSQEDKIIAKEEKMTPAEFIEAEERDDDELFTDEWEN